MQGLYPILNTDGNKISSHWSNIQVLSSNRRKNRNKLQFPKQDYKNKSFNTLSDLILPIPG
jgi:hypothetical protein